MSVINLDAQQIEAINSEIQTLDATLLQTYLPELETELSTIQSNVQGEELNGIIITLNTQFSTVKSALSSELPKLENFLADQMKTYTLTEQELEMELDSVLAKMNNFVNAPNGDGLNPNNEGGITTLDGDSKERQNEETPTLESETKIKEQQALIEQQQKQLEEYQRRLEALEAEASKSSTQKYWEERGSDFSDNFDYSNADSALNYTTATVTGAARTVGDAAETVLDGLGPIGSFAGDIVSGAVDGIAWGVDGIAWGADKLIGWLVG